MKKYVVIYKGFEDNQDFGILNNPVSSIEKAFKLIAEDLLERSTEEDIYNVFSTTDLEELTKALMNENRSFYTKDYRDLNYDTDYHIEEVLINND